MSLMQRLFNFRGGLHLDYRKEMSTQHPIRVAPVPPQLVLPLSQHAGAPAKPVVKVGERVLRGQTIAQPDGFVSVPIHASSSGTVVAIESRPIPHVSGLAAPCIVIDTDGRDESLPAPEWAPVDDFSALDAKTLRETVRRAGIAGLGGAGFPSFIKLSPGRSVETLIINGAECEPYISCDQQLMAERADEIVGGVQVILQAIGAPHCLIGVEDNKPDAIAALRAAAAHDERIQVRVAPTRYPQGGEKQLIQTLTGREVPSEGLPLDIGLVVHNPGTARAVYRAVRHAEPLTARIVTVTGGAVAQPQNFEARIGTPMQFLIEQAGGYVQPPGRLLMGGPMMGFALPSDALPVIKSTNCILAAAPGELRPDEAAMPCIRCGACQEACPVNLLPQQLYWHARGGEFDKTRALNLFDCIECGCCAQVCPSHIPLVQYYRHAKTEIWAEDREKRKADAARERHEARQARLEREEREKEEARARKKAQLAARKAAADPGEAPPAAGATPAVSTDDPVAAAIAAAKAKKAAAQTADGSAATDDPVARAIAAAKAKKAASTDNSNATTPADDPAARAIAAAKAKKAAAETGGPAEAPVKRPRKVPPSDDAVAAAIAAAQARKAAKAAGTEAADAPPADDPVARAIAAAKARKAAAEQAQDAADPVAQVIAAAKAKKTAKEAATAPASDDPVAKAIAEAKAKKSAKEATASDNADDPVARAIAAAKARKAAKDAAATPADDDPVARAIAAAKAKKAAREAADKPDGAS
ncbi:MAG: electron transport complex subunit RsxC [Sinimarinibacterium flocculans]|uniref:electron transport complex subunit RsxC n=1 Tax=Sinimarinibacterium flocculans TaxID=985250 RepID=UPI003C4C4E62